MSRAERLVYAAYTMAFALAVVLAALMVPRLQACCPDPPLPAGWKLGPPLRGWTAANAVLSMDMAPRLAALSCVVATVCLLATIVLFLIHRIEDGRRFGRAGLLTGARALTAFLMTGALNLPGPFYDGYLQLHSLNWIWVLGAPAIVAGVAGRSGWERIWGGPILFVPGWLATMVLMIAFRIDY